MPKYGGKQNVSLGSNRRRGERRQEQKSMNTMVSTCHRKQVYAILSTLGQEVHLLLLDKERSDIFLFREIHNIGSLHGICKCTWSVVMVIVDSGCS